MTTSKRLVRNDLIKVRVSKEVKEELAALARSQGRSASEVARQVLMGWLRSEKRAA